MSIHVRSRAPLMIGMALALALPLILTAGIGIYRAEHAAQPGSPDGRSRFVEDANRDDAGRKDAEPRSETARQAADGG